MNLQGKRVLITGGAKRVGAAITTELASAGCQVIVHSRCIDEKVCHFLESLPGSGHLAIEADLSREDAAEEIFSGIGKIDLLVNNAALFYRPGSPEDLAAADLYHQINFKTPEKLLEKFFTQHLSCGAAVNILDCDVLFPGRGAYWQSKHDLAKLTVELAPLWAEKNFRINGIAPGPVLPPSWAPESRMEKALKRVPLGRPVSVVDLALMVRFQLACDSMTGSVIPLDCGVSAALQKQC